MSLKKELSRQKRYEDKKLKSRKHSVMLYRLLEILDYYYAPIYDLIINLINDKLIGTGTGIKIIIYTPMFKGDLNYDDFDYDKKTRKFIDKNYEYCVLVKRVHTLKSFTFYQSEINLIKFDSNIKIIELNGISNCIFLKRVVFDPNTQLELCADSAFDGCYELNEFIFPKINEIPVQMLASCKLEKIVIPEGATRIGRFAFAENRYLKEVVIPKSMKFIDSSAFSVTGLMEVVIPKDCEYKIEEYEIHGNCKTMTGGSFDKHVNIEYYD
jgi:hypothetical protein